MELSVGDRAMLDGIRKQAEEEFIEVMGREEARKCLDIFFDLPVIEGEEDESAIAPLIVKRTREAVALETALGRTKAATISAVKREIRRILETTEIRTVAAQDIRPFIQWMNSVEEQIDSLLDNAYE